MFPKLFLDTTCPDFLASEIYPIEPILSNRKKQRENKNSSSRDSKNYLYNKFTLILGIVIRARDFGLVNLFILVFIKSVEENVPTLRDLTTFQ